MKIGDVSGWGKDTPCPGREIWAKREENSLILKLAVPIPQWGFRSGAIDRGVTMLSVGDVSRRLWLSLATMSMLACTSDPLQLDNDSLSALLSISDVRKTRVQDTANPELMSGLIVDATVVHTGFVTVDVPFRMTWSIRRSGVTIASATRDFEAGFSPGRSAPVRLTLRFAPVADLGGTSDVVTFDLLEMPTLSTLGG